MIIIFYFWSFSFWMISLFFHVFFRWKKEKKMTISFLDKNLSFLFFSKKQKMSERDKGRQIELFGKNTFFSINSKNKKKQFLLKKCWNERFSSGFEAIKSKEKTPKTKPKKQEKRTEKWTTNENKDEHIVHFYSLNIFDIHRRKRTLIKSEMKREKRQIAGQWKSLFSMKNKRNKNNLIK